jgi:hypothetical protein
MSSRQTIFIEGNFVDVRVVHMAICQECGADVAQPFTERNGRDVWTGQHVGGTGHTVLYATRIDVTGP